MIAAIISTPRRCLVWTAFTALAMPGVGATDELNFNFYGSARVHGESVQPDNTSALGSYTGVRDAYSRIGFNADYALSEAVELFGQLELPLDIANKAVQDPWDQDEDIRVARIGVRGGFGAFTLGQMWMPYYNAIAYPVDMFSSYYSGFATYTAFRLSDTLAYESPEFGGLSFATAWSRRNGAEKSSGRADDRLQITASYRLNDTVFSFGIDDLGGADDVQIYGASLMHTLGDLYIGAKYEVHKSDIRDAYGADGDTAVNLYAGYTLGKNTFKAMVAKVERYGEDVVHLGVDHQFNHRLMFFAEYYYEEQTAAITEKRGGAAETAWDAHGGQVWLAGVRFDF